MIGQKFFCRGMLRTKKMRYFVVFIDKCIREEYNLI